MAIVDCHVVMDGLTGTVDFNQGRQGGSVTVNYQITTDGSPKMPLQIIAQGYSASPDPLPRRGDTYNVEGETDSAIFCRNITVSPKRIGQPNIWMAEVYFGLPDIGRTAAHMNPDPFSRPPVSRPGFCTRLAAAASSPAPAQIRASTARAHPQNSLVPILIFQSPVSGSDPLHRERLSFPRPLAPRSGIRQTTHYFTDT